MRLQFIFNYLVYYLSKIQYNIHYFSKHSKNKIFIFRFISIATADKLYHEHMNSISESYSLYEQMSNVSFKRLKRNIVRLSINKFLYFIPLYFSIIFIGIVIILISIDVIKH